MTEDTTIYTIGHSNVDIQVFLGLLRGKGIGVLVDVRSVPFSKYATQFNRENIEKELKKAGIEYVFMGDVLGGKPEDTGCYINGNVIYEKVMSKQWYREGISKLIGIASRRRTVIMCSEEDPNKCHRNLLVSQSLLRGWLTVLHIRGNGNVEGAKRDSIQVTLH
ncbi:MAG: DUF488 domain-containing protein [Nanoarchaeota archaeon]|nr:DUF488 domain-containing protein [Nanoarchaeota archaeon]